MTVYVDLPVFKRAATKRPKVMYSHMVADTFEELHAFAEKIGVKKHFFHRAEVAHHYDINQDQFALAVQNGAKIVSSKEIVAIGKKQI